MVARFAMGRILATPGVLAALDEACQSPAEFLLRHAGGDWGEVDDVDRRTNERALDDGSRLLSVYEISTGVTIWVITDAASDDGDRPATTILLPEEY
jgi:hypothetical protein